MTIQELIGKTQKTIRDAETAIEALNKIVEAINLEANGFSVIELTVDAAYQLLMAGESPEALSMKFSGQPVADIENTFASEGYHIHWYNEGSDPNSPSTSTGFYYERGDAQCITIVAPK